MSKQTVPPGLADALAYPLVSALTGRRSRRFLMGASIPDGVLAFTSRQAPLPLSELEQLTVLSAVAGYTAWNYLIMRSAKYAPHLSNYAGAAGGRTFPSAAGFHTSEVFYTDDNGTYFFPTRDAPALAERAPDGTIDAGEWLSAHRSRKLGRQPPGEHPDHPGRRPRPASVGGPLLSGAERLWHVRRPAPHADSGAGALWAPG